MKLSHTSQASGLPAFHLKTCLEWIQPDELIEVTPKSIRLRKKGLKPHERKRK